MLEAGLDVTNVRRQIVSFIKDKVTESQMDGVVFELQGGIDSAVTAYLCVEALGTRRVTGLLMPDLRIVDEKDITDAKNVANELCLDVKQTDIAPIHKSFMKGLEENKAAEEELRARARASLLRYRASIANRLVVGTESKSDLLMGELTKRGDGGADILPLGDLYESDVRRLGEALGINRRMIARKAGGRFLRSGRIAGPELEMDRNVSDRILDLRISQGLDSDGISAHTGISKAKVEAILLRYEVSSNKKRSGPEICTLSSE